MEANNHASSSETLDEEIKLIMAIQEPLSRIFSVYCDVNALELVNNITQNLHAYDQELLKKQLSDAIENETISPEEYEKLTDHEFESSEELVDWFKELWEIMFGTPYRT